MQACKREGKKENIFFIYFVIELRIKIVVVEKKRRSKAKQNKT